MDFAIFRLFIRVSLFVIALIAYFSFDVEVHTHYLSYNVLALQKEDNA